MSLEATLIRPDRATDDEHAPDRKPEQAHAQEQQHEDALQCHAALAQALRLAYERNRQAERYHLRGAVRAARHEAAELARQLGAAQQQLQALRHRLACSVS